jgi:NAD(P)-dependent dehydrogenase (short-subunit alcohol dehydrogenase family)
MQAAAAKGAGCATFAGSLVYYASKAVGLSWTSTIALTAAGGVSGLLFYARFWIQGYWIDRRYSGRPDLRGRVVCVTGGTVDGLGFAAAQIFAQLGATVVLTVRTKAKGEECVQRLGPNASYVLVDFLSLASVREGASQISKMVSRCDYLVLNAGVGRGDPAEIWMANHVGPFVFTEGLRPLLQATAKAHGEVRICAVSSGAHKRANIHHENPFDPPTSGGAFAGPYGQSKLAQIMHMRALQARMRTSSGLGGEQAIRCVAITPGFAWTNITPSIPFLLRPLVWVLARSAHVGAQVIKQACLDPMLPGGVYLSNCYVKPTEGRDDVSNQPREWERCWQTTVASVQQAEARFP